jgi:hypothetical protein
MPLCLPKRSGCSVEFVVSDVRVAANGGEVDVAKLGSDKTCISSLLAEPSRGRLAKGMCAHGLVYAGSLG